MRRCHAMLRTAVQQLGKPTGRPDAAVARPGTPAGSYALSGFESVDLYSGALNFHLPLLKVGGIRGESAYPMMLTIQRVWHVDLGTTCEGGSCEVTAYAPSANS